VAARLPSVDQFFGPGTTFAQLASLRGVSNELVGIDSARTPTAEQYSSLADVPPEVEWLANITNSTRSFYKKDVAEFLTFTGVQESSQIGKHAHCRPPASPQIVGAALALRLSV
jgi:hypothetical protein